MASKWSQFGKRRVNYFALGFVIILASAALFAPWIAPHDPLSMDYFNILAAPSDEYWFGTDSLGRDLFSRLIWGARITVVIGFIAAGIATFFGLLMGIPAGYFGGFLDTCIMRFTDMLMSIPDILLALAIIAILGPSINNVIIAIGIASIPAFTRVIRGSTMSIKENDYVTAAKAVGQRESWILIRHILPNVIAPVIVLATLRVAAAVINAAALSFIGLGAQPPAPEWGAILSEARNYMREAWWFTVFPGLAIAMTVLSINIMGDALRDIFDPRTHYR